MTESTSVPTAGAAAVSAPVLVPSPVPAAAPSSTLPCSFLQLLSAIGEPRRWEILNLLLGSEPLPSGLIAKKLGMTQTGATKHLRRLVDARILEIRPGRVYRVVKRWVVPGQRVFDFGAIVLRLDAAQSSTVP